MTATDRLVRHELALRADQKEALRLIAKAQGRSLNDLIREVVDAYLKEEEL